ncbi:MAG: hypothetical protein H6618_06550 [Deltaproteobacteria bacterium]|nr:hypothetical protein [Deltaproteobacteria bacterium]
MPLFHFRAVLILMLLLLSSGLYTRSLLYGEEADPHPWEKYTQGFRKDHHFTLALGSGAGTWNIQRFGVIEKKHQHASSGWLTFQYEFHIQIYKGSGYFLGSSAGYLFEKSGDYISAPSAWHLPGLTGGLVYEHSPTLRFLVFQAVYLERLDHMSTASASDSAELDANMLCFLDAALAADYFFSLEFGLRVEYHYRKSFYMPPAGSTDKKLPEGMLFDKQDHWLGLGLVMHTL